MVFIFVTIILDTLGFGITIPVLAPLIVSFTGDRAAGAYVADVTPVERRAAAFGMVGAAWGLGFILGPGIGGLIGGLGVRLPFWFAAAFSLTSAAYGLFVLPESLPKENRQPFAWRRANPAGSLKL